MTSLCCPDEDWWPIDGHLGYEVSTCGRVRRLVPARLRKPSKNSRGYLTVTLAGRSFKVHVLVMAAFGGPRNGRDVNHLNCDKTNNHRSNLEYCTRAENMRHAYRNGLHPRPTTDDAHIYSRLTPEIIREIHQLKGTMSQRVIAKRFGLCQQAVCDILRGRRWTNIYAAVCALGREDS